ncbi:MAG: hypothetical protein EP330_30800 [Deltaproteobacteria bacterium]|nr:MAG: hypothetical protein EP330_30800 [Deltaproteobacteria bacterium]
MHRALIVSALLFTACQDSGEGTPLGVALADGQIIVGEIQTETLLLDGAFGLLEVPLSDVGAVFPAEGERVADGGGAVTVWLRNGSELRGQWAEPELRIGLDVGGKRVPIDMPVADMTSVQTRGTPIWPDREVFRVKTTWGDDFLVDAESSQLVLQNDLGSFAPFLAECVKAEPVTEDPTGDWRIELVGGTTLVGPLADGEVTFLLPMGPGEVTVALADFVSLERQSWGHATKSKDDSSLDFYAEPEAAEVQAIDTGYRPRPAARSGALSSGEGWFDQRALQQEKARH